ncbi:MAG: sulfatase-like hydrolase/transferase [Planctomycetes bacterium]|nr:sulfatase-like hydrolase/transferase [Planctomycetota bacterium]
MAILLLFQLISTSNLGVSSSNSLNKGERPNIIFFIADDMYPDMFNCLPQGKGQNLTPNIDRLAREGVLLKNQYVASPVCTPSRFNCLTGRYASRATNDEFINFTKKNDGQTVIQWNSFVTKKDKIIPHYLKELGYATGMVGKNHVIEVNDLESFKDYWADPRKSEVMAKVKRNYKKTKNAILNTGFDYAESVYYDNPNWIGLGHLAMQNMEWIASAGVDFIDKYKKQPFFLYFATTIPHGPTQPERSWKADPTITANGYINNIPRVMPDRKTLPKRVKAAGIKGQDKELVLWLDDALGALLGKLEEYQLMDNTIIFFFNDHGQKAKGHLYQGGIHNPSIIWKSNGFKCGHVSDALVQNIDFAPTIVEFAGGGQLEGHFDGQSFKSVLDGQGAQSREASFFELGFARGVIMGDLKYMAIRYPKFANERTPQERSAVLEEYNSERIKMKIPTVNDDPMAKYSHFSIIPGGQHAEHGSYGRTEAYFAPDQLYDLSKDPHETKNLVKDPEYKSRLEKMKNLLKKHLKQMPGSFGDLKL